MAAVGKALTNKYDHPGALSCDLSLSLTHQPHPPDSNPNFLCRTEFNSTLSIGLQPLGNCIVIIMSYGMMANKQLLKKNSEQAKKIKSKAT